MAGKDGPSGSNRFSAPASVLSGVVVTADQPAPAALICAGSAVATATVSALLQVREGGRDEDEDESGRDEGDATAVRDEEKGRRLALLVTGGTSGTDNTLLQVREGDSGREDDEGHRLALLGRVDMVSGVVGAEAEADASEAVAMVAVEAERMLVAARLTGALSPSATVKPPPSWAASSAAPL